MSGANLEGLSDLSLVELFRMEVEAQVQILTEGLLAIENGAEMVGTVQALMRAAHSVKGAARIVNRPAAISIAHAMEDCFVAAQKGEVALGKHRIDLLLQATDLLTLISGVSEETMDVWAKEHQATVENLSASLSRAAEASSEVTVAPPHQVGSLRVTGEDDFAAPVDDNVLPGASSRNTVAAPAANAADRTLRITSDNLNRLLGLAGETLIASRWLHEFEAEILRLKQQQDQLARTVEELRDSLLGTSLNDRVSGRLLELQTRASGCRQSVVQRLADLDVFDCRLAGVASRLYDEVLACRMRPFVEVTQGFGRMVRELSRALGKSVKLVVHGESSAVDRDVMERLKAPLDHLLRNAVDHGIESPRERRERKKSDEGVIELEARHHAGMLVITVTDDGRGIDVAAVRDAVVDRKLASSETVAKMNDEELLEFLFLPGFTLRTTVTEISGRGVGLDVVHSMTKAVGGRIRVSSHSGFGTTFQLELPLTLSVIRMLLMEIAGEPYALPLARVEQVLALSVEQIESQEGHLHFALGDQQIGLVTAHQILNLGDAAGGENRIFVVVIGVKPHCYGMVVDRFLGEREMAVRSLDPRLGKVQNISAAAMMPDGSPVLILDVDDLLRSIEVLVSGSSLVPLRKEPNANTVTRKKRVLVVEDSLTVRELERKLLGSEGYEVQAAVDGMDGWNALRAGHFDLVLTDIDMPRMDGIELLTLIRRDPRFKALPVMIVSYKERPEDRRRGMEAGADYYLTKGSFHDETLIRAVADLVGGPEA